MAGAARRRCRPAARRLQSAWSLGSANRERSLVKRILVLYYSQTGDVRRMAESFVQPLASAGATVVWREIQPTVEYPSPWRNVHRFFNIMPECVLGLPPPIRSPELAASDRFDLIVLAYQVWFSSPSLPIQGFFRTESARVLRGSNVITISVSRNMWHRASLRMRDLLEGAGAIHLDGIVATHQGPPWATFITTTRTLFTGKRDRLWGVFPPAGLPEDAAARMAKLGSAVAQRLGDLADPAARPLLRGLGAVEVNRRYVIPELVAASFFPFWARAIRGLGRLGAPLRHVGVFLFLHFLLLMIVSGIPLSILTLPVVYPFVRKTMAAHISRLRQPTES